MEAGIIRNWYKDKAYGFIQARNPADPDVFLHIREIRNLAKNDVPANGDLVLFDLAPPDEGRPSPKAVNALLIMQGDEP